MRYSAVQSKIAAWSRAGELETAWRAKAGGQEIIIPKEWWNIDVLSPRFDFCQVNPNAPFGEGNTGEDFGWIFATRESLLKAVAGLFKWQDAITNRNRKKAAEGAKPTELWKREIEEKYRDRIKLFEGRTPPTRVADEAYLKETFGLNRHRARDLRRRLAPAHWKTAGTRKRKAP